MTDTIRTKAELLALFPDNSSGLGSCQDLRDFIASIFNSVGILDDVTLATLLDNQILQYNSSVLVSVLLIPTSF